MNNVLDATLVECQSRDLSIAKNVAHVEEEDATLFLRRFDTNAFV